MIVYIFDFQKNKFIIKRKKNNFTKNFTKIDIYYPGYIKYHDHTYLMQDSFWDDLDLQDKCSSHLLVNLIS